jgi:hypothetical protein
VRAKPEDAMRRLTLTLTLALALPAAAETAPMDAAAFEAYTRGKTLSYAAGGRAYGIEQYLPDRGVIWWSDANTCLRGTWYQQDEQICFRYEDEPGDPACWVFTREQDGLRARLVGDGATLQLTEIGPIAAPPPCPGPDVGV